MTRFSILLSLLLSNVSAVYITCKATPANDAARISGEAESALVRESMDQLRRSLLERDSVVLASLLSDDLTYGHTNGWMQTKQELIQSVMSGQQEYKSITVHKTAIRLYGTTAIVNAESDVSLIFNGKPMELDVDILLVWILRDGVWRLAARQSVRNN